MGSLCAPPPPAATVCRLHVVSTSSTQWGYAARRQEFTPDIDLQNLGIQFGDYKVYYNILRPKIVLAVEPLDTKTAYLEPTKLAISDSKLFTCLSIVHLLDGIKKKRASLILSIQVN